MTMQLVLKRVEIMIEAAELREIRDDVTETKALDDLDEQLGDAIMNAIVDGCGVCCRVRLAPAEDLQLPDGWLDL